MSFDINRDRPWIEAVFRRNQKPTIDLGPQLEYLARISKSDDTYIDENELRQGRNSSRVDPFTCDLISYFIKHRISAMPWMIRPWQKKITVYDDSDGRFNINSNDWSTHIFIAQNAQGDWQDITSSVVSTAKTQNIVDWKFPENGDGVSLAALKVLYSLSLTKGESPKENANSDITDFVHISDVRELNETIYPGETKIATQVLSLLLASLREHPQTLNREKLFLVIIEINHLIDMTDGVVGLELFQELSDKQWQLLLQDQDMIEAMVHSLSNAVKVQNWTFFRKFYNEPEKLGDVVVIKLSTQSPQENPGWHDVIMVAALLRSLPKPPVFLIPEYLEPLLRRINQPQLQLPPSIVTVILESFASLAKRNCDPKIRSQAFDWCREFYQDFTSFHDKSAANTGVNDTSDYDRLIIAHTQEVLMLLNAQKAESVFFQEVISPLSFDFNSRTEIALAHNTYYRHIGAAQNLALLSGNKKLARQRQLDQSENEWGRDLEYRMRTHEIFRIDTLNEDPTSPQKTPTEKIVDRYDPEGILKRNLAFIHVLRFIYLQRIFFDPAIDTTHSNDFLKTLDVEKIITFNFDDHHYKNDAEDFDAWLMELRKNNRIFFDALADSLRTIEKDIKLSFEVFFMEANEMETYQYYLDPHKGPMALMDFVGAIRSWTSGYQGRLLVRMQAFFIQDKIRADKEKHPDSYKKPEEYYADFSSFMTKERFEDADFGILPILKEGENPRVNRPTQNMQFNFSADEACKILFYFSQSGFSAYITDWIFFIIDHHFVDEVGNEAFGPMEEAFTVLSKTKFPRELMAKEFEKRGYLTSRQSRLVAAANLCLSQLPSRHFRYHDSPEHKIHSSITLIDFFDSNPNMKHKKKMIDDFINSRAKPDSYQKYRRQARQLLKTHDWQAIDAIVNEALHNVPVFYKANAPLKPLFPGLIGNFVTNDNLDEALHNIATGNSREGNAFKSIDFSNIMTRWAQKNHIDLDTAFSEAFRNYEVPSSISSIQDEIIAIKKEITLTEDAQRLEELHRSLDFKTKQRNRMINDLATQPQTYGQQAIIQIITSVYNAVRRQYLREILISGGEITGGLIESFLEDNLLPKKDRILHSTFLDNGEAQKELKSLDQKIGFLIDVLAQIEGVEYFNDFNSETMAS